VSFKGDVSQIPLSNIIQALLLNGQEGVLTLEVGPVRRKISVLKQGLRLLNSQPESPDLLKHLLTKQKILTESQFQNIFSSWIPGESFPGDFLVARRILTREQVTTLICHQIENLLLELIVTPGVKYEFNAGADGRPLELFQPDDLGQELVLSANAVLMEALRREDEMQRIREVITSPTEIFTPVNRNNLSAKDLDIPPKVLKELRQLLNGENSVARLISQTALSSFEVHHALYRLLDRKLVRPLNLTERKNLAERLRKSLRPEDAIDALRSILASEPDDSATRLKLIGLLEKDKEKAAPELTEHYLILATPLLGSEDAQALKYLQSILEIAPKNLQALEMLFDLHRRAQDNRNALSVARQVAVSAQNPDHAKSAARLLEKIISFYPEEAILYQELADLHLHARQTEDAVSCLLTAADLYNRKGDVQHLRRTYDMIARIRPAEAEKLQQAAKRRKKPRASRRMLSRKLLLGGVCLIFLGAGAFLALTEYRSQVAYASLIKNMRLDKSKGSLSAALSSLEQFMDRFPYSTRVSAVKQHIVEIGKLQRKKVEDDKQERERRRVQSETVLTRAKLAYEGQEYIKAADLLSQVDASLLSEDRAAEARRVDERIQTYFSRAADLLAQSTIAEQKQDYVRSHQLRQEIFTKYPYSRAAIDLLLPVRVETLPEGAEVSMGGQVIGRTPILLRLPPRKLLNIVLTRPGYKPRDLSRDGIGNSEINTLASHIVRIPLEKMAAWQVPAGGPIEGYPAVVQDKVFFGTRSGTIYCAQQESGTILWKFKIPESMDFAGGIGAWNNLIYFGSFDGKLYALEASSGKLAFEPFAASPDLWPIKTAPSAASAGGLVALNCDRRLVATFNLSTGKAGWSLPSPSGQILGQPLSAQGVLYLATSQGDVLALDHDTGEIRHKMSLGSELNAAGQVARGLYFQGTAQGKILCLDLEREEVVWTKNCGGPVLAPPTVDGEWLLVSTAAGSLQCFSVTGQLKWTREVPDMTFSSSEGVVFRNNLLLGTAHGQVFCMDLWSGTTIWAYNTLGYSEKEQKGLLSRGVIAKGKYFVGSEDHNFYCFTID